MMNKNHNITISKLLFAYSPRALVLAVMLGIVSGALYSLIIPFILQGLKGEADSLPLVGLSPAQGFFIFVVTILFTKVSSVILVNNIAKSATAALKLSIINKVNKMGVDKVEQIGFSKILNLLTDDVTKVGSAAVAIPMIIVSLVTILGMLGYLAYLDVTIFALILTAIIVGIFLFQIPVMMAKKLYIKSRELKDGIQEGVKGLIFGSYELKLNNKKSKEFIDEEIARPLIQSVSHEKVGDGVIHLAGNASEIMCFFVIGGVVFLMPGTMYQNESDIYGIVMALLYITAPIANILGMMQALNMGQVALGRVNQLNAFEAEQMGNDNDTLADNWQKFSAEGVTYAYENTSDEAQFSLSPVNLTFNRHEINFIVGGNGSGKSTLSKLLSLHYKPTLGHLAFDGQIITEDNLEQARSRIGVIFSNYYLFQKLYEPIDAVNLAQVEHYLDIFKLKDKTKFIDNRFTTTQLSDGQRRRLALLVALLEDKDIYIFDEWAADQDPEFKSFFYEDVLQEMKRNGKLVIVITHDDRYFSCADKIIKMDSGQLVAVEKYIQAESLPQTSANHQIPLYATEAE